ncbi:hypothetical protein KUV80_02160 [Fictibacillus nanhaiensis]|uniref:hypothetical protein n=1 Tax=Fictibacillus nanhaiensis TaxID=742169 RepID=UPI001C94214A|nr:hypothetical protein [Fictibacillus nanhaiensis]MBY6035439.1 hypothetical protein [Fictibacillus nanhaiensis]
MNIIEAIIELLIANIAFVIIIAGGLYSFFKRMNDTKETNRPAPVKRANEQPQKTVSPFGVPAQRKAAPVGESILSASESTGSEDRINQRLEMAKKANRYKDKENIILQSFKVNQEELQKAVIWSEILSKPKALRNRS